jgi:hypothetical protein
MNFSVSVIRNGIEKAEDVFACFRVEAIDEHSVGGIVLAKEFDFRIIDDDIAIVFDAQFTANLQDDSSVLSLAGHARLLEMKLKSSKQKGLAAD